MSAPVAVASPWPAFAILLPLLAAVALAIGVPRRLLDPFVLIAVAATAALALAATVVAQDGRAWTVSLIPFVPSLWLALRADAAGALFGATVAGLGLLALVHALGYFRDDPRKGRALAFGLACLSATLGVAYAGNLLTFLVFFEALSVLTYALVVHERTPAAFAAGLKYIVYVLVGGSAVLAGTLLVYAAVGDLSFVPGGVMTGDARNTLRIAFWCFAGGFGVKAALVPLHGWVPDAHPAAPAPFSALLSGVLVAAGTFGIIRVTFEVFGASVVRALGVAPPLAAIAAASVLIGAVLALRQPDLKRRLAYSTISQMAYVTLAVALLGATVTAAALVHLVHHAFLKGTLFLCAGLWRRGDDVHTVDDLRGLAARTPLTAAAFALASFGMIGLPPLSGFVSKWWLGVGMLEVGAGWAVVVLLLGALLAAGYLLPVVHALYFRQPVGVRSEQSRTDGGREADLRLLAPTLVAAALTLLFGLGATLSGFPVQLAQRAAAAWWGGG